MTLIIVRSSLEHGCGNNGESSFLTKGSLRFEGSIHDLMDATDVLWPGLFLGAESRIHDAWGDLAR